jgi:hypothetical protein
MRAAFENLMSVSRKQITKGLPLQAFSFKLSIRITNREIECILD